jgi:hypothetical protein
LIIPPSALGAGMGPLTARVCPVFTSMIDSLCTAGR